MIEQGLLSAVGTGIEEACSFLIHWPFLILFVAITYAINKIAKSEKFKKKVKVKTRTFLRSGIIALILGVILTITSDAVGFKEILKVVLRLLSTTLFVMLILIVGLKNVVTDLKKNWQTVKNLFKTT